MDFKSVFTVKKEICEDDFLRAVLVKLAASSKTPVDVVNARFGAVQESIREVILGNAYVQTDYTASVGYDRTEHYMTTEKKYDSKTKEYYYVNVPKTRTVTDWHPYSGSISGEKVCAAFNENDCTMAGLVQHDLLAKVITTTDDDSVVPGGEARVSPLALETVKENCAFFVHGDIEYPGDRVKDKRYQDQVTVDDSLSCYRLPFYEVDFTYNGKQYRASGFACGVSNVMAEMPIEDISIEEKAKKETQKLKTLKTNTWFGFLGSFALSCLLCGIGIYWSWFVPLIALVAAVVLHVQYDRAYIARIHSLTDDVAVTKMCALNKALQKYGYSALNQTEIKEFDYKDEAKKVISGQKKSKVKKWATFGTIATAVLIIVSLVSNKNATEAALHSPGQVEIVVADKTQEYQSNVPMYVNGCYFIYLDFEIAADEIGVEDMCFMLHVSDKKGKELGTIKTSLSYMDLKAGKTGTYTTEWKDNQPEQNNNEFFLKLYDTDFEDLVFTYEFEYIHFDDGKYYHGEIE